MYSSFAGFCIVFSLFIGFSVVQGQVPQPTREMRELWGQAPPPRVTVPRADEAPRIDGAIDEPAWRTAAVAQDFIRVHALPGNALWGIDPADAQTSVRILRDEQFLYFAFTCDEPRMDRIRTDAEESPQVPQDDSVGIALEVRNNGAARLFQIWVNAANKVHVVNPDGGELGEGVRSEVTRQDNAWQVELAVPFEELGVPAPESGDMWRINFVRQRPGRERSMWSGQPETELPVAARLGELHFGDVALTEVDFPQPFLGRLNVKGTLHNRGDEARRLVVSAARAGEEQPSARRQIDLPAKAQASFDVFLAIETEGTRLLYITVEEDEQPLVVLRRSYHVEPLSQKLEDALSRFDRLLDEHPDDWELDESVREQRAALESVRREMPQQKRAIVTQPAGPQNKEAWAELSRMIERAVRDSGWFEPLALYLTWQSDPTSTMTVQWQSYDSRYDKLQYRAEDEEAWHDRTGWTRPMPYSPRMIHMIELGGLDPDTTYIFRFAPGLPEHRFRTMPLELERPVRFASGGDTMHRREWFEQMSRVAASYDPEFMLMGGDLAYADGRPDRTDRWYDWLDVVTDTMIAPDGRIIPIIVAIGNHEVRGAFVARGGRVETAPYFYSLFAFPGLQGYNVLDFGQYMSVIALDTWHTNEIEGRQTEWLDRVLRDRQDVPHVFPFYHVPAYPSHRAYDGHISRRVREHWVPLFEQYDLRVVFENHDHAYKRTHPIRDGEIDPTGVVYLGDGCWGVGVRSVHNVDETWYLAAASSTQHVFIATIDGQRRSFVSVDIDGEIIEEFEINGVTAAEELAADANGAPE